MDFLITLDNFNGPMDLLLHLVKETKLDIYEIKMQEIIDKYLQYINTLQDLNVEVSSSFLLMAATLIHLKSKKLIGKTEEKEEDLDDEFSIASEEDLKQKIIAYEQYQKMTNDFSRLAKKRAQIYTKLPENPRHYQLQLELFNEEGLDSNDLMNALLKVLQRAHYKEPKETKITKNEISVASRKIWIRKKLETCEKCLFEELFEIPRKDYIIATFLAILEMSKESMLTINQEAKFKQIWIRRI